MRYLIVLLLAGCAGSTDVINAATERSASMSPSERLQACSAAVSQMETFCRGPGPFYGDCANARQLIYGFCPSVDKQTAC